MQWIVGHGPEFRLVVIYIRYWSVVDSLQWNVESNLELDFEGVSTSMSFSGLDSKLIYYDDTIYESWIGSRFTLLHKGVLVITQGCTRHS